MKIEISPVTAVTCNPQFQVLEDAAIHISGQTITYVGPTASAPAFAPDTRLGGSHLVAMPGMVNTHTHAAMTLMRGYADDMALEPWLHEKIWPYEKNLEADHVYWGTLLAVLEMVRGGTTCVADMYFYYREGIQAMIQSGIRACPGATLLGFLPGAEGKIADSIAFVREFTGAADGRMTPFLAPHSLYTCTASQWEKLIAGAADLGVTIHTHASETQREVADVTGLWGQSPIQTLHKIGALQGPMLLAHCVFTSERDREIMAGHRLSVAHNPQSNLKLASGVAPIPDYLARGITVGLGPDGTASNNNLDMWEEMRLAATLHKASTGNPTAITARQALEMATIEGARCLGLEQITGSLEVGKKADVVLVDFDQPHLYPRHNVVSHLVYAAGAADVRTTIVDGRVLYHEGTYPTMDAPQICRKAQEIASKLVRLAE